MLANLPSLPNLSGLAEAAVSFPSQDESDYTNVGTECPWYQERKASGSQVSCQFPSTMVVIAAAAGVLAMVLIAGRS
jgi:hypothetical protein